MSIILSEKERRLPFQDYLIEGTESGLTDDLRYRPNKYFHPIEAIDLYADACSIRYSRSIGPVEGELRIEQVYQVLLGAIDAQQRAAHDQIFYLFPGVEAFGLDRRHNLRIAVINARPQKDRDCDPQEMSVDAFVRLIAAHCPEAHKRIVAYNKPILTLRHLLQILDYRGRSVLAAASIALLLTASLVFVLLHQYAPPRIRKPLQQWTKGLLYASQRFSRSGTDEWFAQIGEERRQREYNETPLSLHLILQPKVKSDEERQSLFQSLNRLLASEFPTTRYQLLIPSPTLSAKSHAQWKKICENAFQQTTCSPQSWLLQIPEYRGAIRPLLHALREAMQQKRANEPSITIRHVEFIGIADLQLEAPAPPPTPPTPRSAATPPTPTTPPAPANPSTPPTPTKQPDTKQPDKR